MHKLYYFHDPMCSWCWGYRPVVQELFRRLPENVLHVNVLGGLAPDSDEPMGVTMRNKIIGHWRNIEKTLGTKFNYDFWKKCQPRRSTYPACRAVIAAARQGKEEAMILAVQRAYYLQARNPSESRVLVALAGELGIDPEIFKADLESRDTDLELKQQIGFSRRLGVDAFPSLIFEKESGEMRRLTVDYLTWKPTLADVETLSGAAPVSRAD